MAMSLSASFDKKLDSIAKDLAHLNFNGLQNDFTGVRALPSTYSTKVFVGGLPQDIDQDEIRRSFEHLGPLTVEWPGQEGSRSPFPPKGFAFLMFAGENSVFRLLQSCTYEGGDLYFTTLSSPSIKNKKVQVRPWKCCDARWLVDASIPVNPRFAVFVGAVPRTVTAKELGAQVDRIFGGVQLVEIDVEKEIKYPKGAARITFANEGCFIAAVVGRFFNVEQDQTQKRVEMKPFILENQVCDECSCCVGALYCGYVGCFKYFCQGCWESYHSTCADRENHKPLLKDTDRTPRAAPSNLYSFN